MSPKTHVGSWLLRSSSAPLPAAVVSPCTCRATPCSLETFTSWFHASAAFLGFAVKCFHDRWTSSLIKPMHLISKGSNAVVSFLHHFLSVLGLEKWRNRLAGKGVRLPSQRSGVRFPLGPARSNFVDIYFSPFNVGDCVSLVARMSTQMAKQSHWLGVGRKRITEDGKLPGSNHPQCPYRPISLGPQWK